MSAAAAAGVGQMSGLSSEKQSAAAAAMQFPLTQRRKRRVLFTQAQVCKTTQQIIQFRKKSLKIRKSVSFSIVARFARVLDKEGEDYYLFPVCPQ